MSEDPDDVDFRQIVQGIDKNGQACFQGNYSEDCRPADHQQPTVGDELGQPRGNAQDIWIANCQAQGGSNCNSFGYHEYSAKKGQSETAFQAELAAEQQALEGSCMDEACQIVAEVLENRKAVQEQIQEFDEIVQTTQEIVYPQDGRDLAIAAATAGAGTVFRFAGKLYRKVGAKKLEVVEEGVEDIAKSSDEVADLTSDSTKLKGNGKGDNGSFEAEGDFGSLNQPVKEVVPDSTNKVSTSIQGSVDHPHEVIQAQRFGDLYGGGVVEFGNVTPGIEGYFIKQGTDMKTPFSLKDLSGAGKIKNIFREIKSNAKTIQKHETLPQSDAMSLPVGTSENTVIHVNSPQFSAQEIISFVNNSKPNIFQPNAFKEILIDTNSGVVVIDSTKKASLRN